MNDIWKHAIASNGTWLTISVLLFAVMLSLFPAILPILLILFLICWWIRFPIDVQWQWMTPLPWMLLLYVLHVIGMAWSTNWDYGLFDLQVKLPLLLIPLIGILRPGARDGLVVPALLGLVIGNSLAVIAGVINIFLSADNSDALLSQVVFGPVFSFIMHPSYFALQLLFGLAGIFLTSLYRKLSTLFLPLVLALHCVGIILSGSKMGWLLLPLVLFWIMIVQWKERSIRGAIMGIGLIVFLGLSLLVMLSPFALDRVREAINAVLQPGIHAEAGTSTEVRKLAWSTAVEVSRSQFPWGTGTGDVKDELIENYQANDYTFLVEHRINAHNQYLQMFAALGLIGSCLTILILLLPLLRKWKRIHPLFPMFLVLSAFNWAVESMLEVQAGVMFFSFFALLLSPSKERTSRHDPVQSAAH